MSQTALADHVGVTFQQVQKYERGTNRVPASRLYEFARVLGRPLGYFFADHAAAAVESDSATSALSRLRGLDEAHAARLQAALEACPPAIRDDLIRLVSSVDARDDGQKA